MGSQIKELVAMRDYESLNEIMNDGDDFVLQLDAAESLISLGDQRGMEFLLIAAESEDEDISGAAQEILDGPVAKRMREDIEAEQKQARQKRVQTARNRLQKGRKVFTYKMIYVASGDIMQEDPLGLGYSVPDLDDAGLEGWEVVNFFPRRGRLLVGGIDDHFVGAYFLLKKELVPEDASELDEI
jgi:hypothetical protein